MNILFFWRGEFHIHLFCKGYITWQVDLVDLPWFLASRCQEHIWYGGIVSTIMYIFYRCLRFWSFTRLHVYIYIYNFSNTKILLRNIGFSLHSTSIPHLFPYKRGLLPPIPYPLNNQHQHIALKLPFRLWKSDPPKNQIQFIIFQFDRFFRLFHGQQLVSGT